MSTCRGRSGAPRTPRKVARTCERILTASENENPYAIARHLSKQQGSGEDCEEPDIWLDDNQLVPREELEEGTFFLCPACQYNYILWEEILFISFDEGESPTAEYGDRVFAAFALEQHIEDGFFDQKDISASEYDDLKIVKAERRRLEAFRAWERAQQAAAAQASKAAR